MNPSGDAAEQVVKLSLEGTEFAVRIAGKGAEKIAVFLVAAMQGAKRTKGKTRLTSLLKSGKELKVFSLPEKDLKRFASEAKKYGVLYAALRGIKRDGDGMVDIMCRAEDASKINRIFDRFAITAIDTAAVREEALRSLEAQEEAPTPPDIPVPPEFLPSLDGDDGVPEAPDIFAPPDTLPEIPEPPEFLPVLEDVESAPAAPPVFEDLPPIPEPPRYTAEPKPENPTQARKSENRSESYSESRPDTSADSHFPDTSGNPSVKKQLDKIRRKQKRQNRGKDAQHRDSRSPSQGKNHNKNRNRQKTK